MTSQARTPHRGYPPGAIVRIQGQYGVITLSGWTDPGGSIPYAYVQFTHHDEPTLITRRRPLDKYDLSDIKIMFKNGETPDMPNENPDESFFYPEFIVLLKDGSWGRTNPRCPVVFQEKFETNPQAALDWFKNTHRSPLFEDQEVDRIIYTEYTEQQDV